MPRYRVPLEQLQANLEKYHSYLLQDPCANPRAQAYVEARISLCQGMSSPKSDCFDSGELAGSRGCMSSSGPNRLSASRKRAIATT